jgi:hypothetical protein
MTDEERQNLCDRLRHLPAYMSEDGMRAADEIERLHSENDWLRTALRAAQTGDFAKYAAEYNREFYDKTKGHAVTTQSDAEPSGWQCKARGRGAVWMAMQGARQYGSQRSAGL